MATTETKALAEIMAAAELTAAGPVPCLYCRRPLVFRGAWRHQDDGSTYAQRCACGWAGGRMGSYAECPRCGSRRDLRDDHAATPDRG